MTNVIGNMRITKIIEPTPIINDEDKWQLFCQNSYKVQPQEIIPVHEYHETYEQAALAGIEYVLDNLI